MVTFPWHQRSSGNYVIQVPFGATAITTVYSLLLNKTWATYNKELFQAVADKYAELDDELNLQIIVLASRSSQRGHETS